MRLEAGIAVASAAIALVVPIVAPTPPGASDAFTNARAGDDVVQMLAATHRAAAQAAAEAAARGEPSPWEYGWGARCGTGETTGDALAVGCVGERPECEDGAAPLLPLFRRPAGSTDENVWVQVADWVCPQDVVPAFTATDLRDLLIVSGVAGLNPATGPLLVNAPNVVFTDAVEQTFTPVLLGFGFEVVVTPTSYRWDFGDGSTPVETTDPGKAFVPGTGDDLDGYLTHTYTDTGSHAITVTTTWSGRWRVPGRTEWADVLGTATTMATSRTFEVVERRSTLVAATCQQDPDAPGCD